MNRLPLAKRIQILSMLCEGSSMRSISGVCDVSINTVSKLLVEAGEACLRIHDKLVHKVEANRIQCDEIWSFCYAKDRTVRTGKELPEGVGDVWTWTAIDADTKLILSYFVGDRSRRSACAFMSDLHGRVTGRPQITTDQWLAYLPAVHFMFGPMVDFAQLVKIFRNTPGQGRYSPGECCGTKTKVRMGDPRKKLDNHIHAIALYFVFYNFCRIHKSLRVSPAMAAGVSDRLWSLEDVVAKIDEMARPPKLRGSYKKRSL
jgi:IS1 family transposase